MKNQENRQILELTAKALTGEPIADLPENATQPEYFQLLQKRLKYLLDHNMAGLLQGLYRMDVDEDRVHEILAITHPDNMATELTMLVWERAKKKVETRRKYGK